MQSAAPSSAPLTTAAPKASWLVSAIAYAVTMALIGVAIFFSVDETRALSG